MSRLRTTHWLLLAVAAAAAAGFCALGVWQLDRHGERTARNDTLRSRLDAPAVDGSAGRLAGDSLAWRRVRLRGRYDYAREVVLRGRAHDGTPGVYVVTPLRRGNGSAVLVVRGWMPAADGLHAPLSRGRPDAGAESPVAVRGVLLASAEEARANVGRRTVDGEQHLVASHVNVSAIADSLPYAVAPLYVQRTAPGPDARESELPAVLSSPAPEPGPHLWYALQWFGFAAIAVGGTAAYLYTDLRGGTDAEPAGRPVDPGRARS